ncbi:MAG: hypothetical protein RIT81_25760 [Deltaproteobacteria bacterium]
MTQMKPEHFVSLEKQTLAAIECLRRTGGVADSSGLGIDLDLILWSHWGDLEKTKGYWQDGHQIDLVELVEDRILLITCQVWCADERRLWLVAAQFSLELAPARSTLERAIVRIGDGAVENLRDQIVPRRFRRPRTWLCELELVRPQNNTPDPEPLLRQLHEWVESNPGGKIVGSDWEELPIQDAERRIRREARVGRGVQLASTWLDGGPALQLTRLGL